MPTSNFTIELPFGPPPILPDLGEQFEAYLTKPENLPLHNAKNNFKFWNREINLDSLYQVELSPVATTLRIDRDYILGKLVDFREVPVEGIGQTSKNSSSLTRLPGKVTDDVRGSRTNYPFWPGGFDPPSIPEPDENFNINFDTEFLNVAPGLSRGFDFTSYDMVSSKLDETSEENIHTVNLRNVMADFGKWSISSENTKKIIELKQSENESEENAILEEVKIPVLNISKTSLKIVAQTEFAELLDTTKPVVNFEKKIRDPAVKYDFELDTFQKLAILKLEKHEHVFVAAHTSAGKTVVAEYAIGLSQKHCTKTIYTSPIKALSNQKYRDFKNKFSDVGLITGDYRVNQQASCLIMTTEILRSMLYGGSDVIRDVEFVIFDEVHYINDSERGHVWEEILIMLPSIVCIVMLSATVPNVLEFADWVGRTKRAKMFVVSTMKRPVPLQHFLYTGHENKNQNLFLIKNAEGPFILDGYSKARASLEKTKSEADKTRGPKKLLPLKPANEKPYWIFFAKYLKKYDKLPVVAFTLSRAKCDRNADLLAAIDLTTQEEKNFISHYFKESINILKEEDRELPQILKMEMLLTKGIAKHHSGILPILKEIVEILFQKGLVKFLFATETFAMGVNMPAKTVAFDSIRKFDGTASRYLQPAEYIQMAGRAGRRGQDDTGTVIILCKQTIENDADLRNMMTGLPTKLESQFRMTYSMILNLLRVKGMSVEDIMSHSFKELHSRRQLKNYRRELNELQKEEDRVDVKNKFSYQKLEQFYEACSQFIESWNNFSLSILGSAKMQKELVPGRFIVVSHMEHINKLALILQTISKRNSFEFKIMILYDVEESASSQECDTFYRMLGLSRKDIFVPSAKPKDKLLMITTQSIIAVTKYHTRMEFDLVLKDCDQRQIVRFKDNPPSQTCERAIYELNELSRKIRDQGGLKGPHFLSLQEMKINNINLRTALDQILREKSIVDSFDLYNEISDFESQFKNVFLIEEKEARKKHLEYLLSHESLQLYPDYQNKINVLRQLKYINEEDIVELKGKVACEMGSNELIITELIFQNSLSKYNPAEIAALLSCLVFQVRTDDDIEPKLTERLKEGIKTIKQVYESIAVIEEPAKAETVSLNFGLVQVVYEWAHGKPFAQIMELVEDKVQEGIIVRCIQQLNEILCDIKDAAKLFGDLVLKKKMEEASEAIKRDIVFAASLYTQ